MGWSCDLETDVGPPACGFQKGNHEEKTTSLEGPLFSLRFPAVRFPAFLVGDWVASQFSDKQEVGI